MGSDVISIVQKEVRGVRVNGEPFRFNIVVLIPSSREEIKTGLCSSSLHEFVCRYITINGQKVSVEQFELFELPIAEAILKVFVETVNGEVGAV